MDRDEYIRRIAKEVAGLRQQLAQTIVSGTVMEVKGDKVRLDLGIDGRESVPSPLVRLGYASGKQGGASAYMRPGEGESMLLISPGGRIGAHSRAIPAGPVDDNPAPGAAETDGFVLTYGESEFRITPQGVTLSHGGTSVALTSQGITINGQAVTITGDSLRHNGRNVGDSHVHGGIFPGPANTGIPAN